LAEWRAEFRATEPAEEKQDPVVEQPSASDRKDLADINSPAQAEVSRTVEQAVALLE
jgi:hypothetical protein